MNNEEKLNNLEEKVDAELGKDALYSMQEGAEHMSKREAEIKKLKEMKEQIKISEEAQNQANNLHNPENPFSDIFNLDDTNTFDKGLAEEQAKEMERENTKEKAKQKQLVMKPNKFNSNGFAEGFLFTLLVGFASGAIFTIAYILLNAGKYSFIM